MQKNLTYTLDSWALSIVAPQLDRNLYLLDKLFWETAILFCQNEDARYAQDVFGLPLSIVSHLKRKPNPAALAQAIQLSFAPVTTNIKELINSHISGNYEVDDLDISKETHKKYRKLIRLYCLTVHRVVMENRNNLKYLMVNFGIDSDLSRYLTRLNIANLDRLANNINLKYRLRYSYSTLESLLNKSDNHSEKHFFLFQRIAQSLAKSAIRSRP